MDSASIHLANSVDFFLPEEGGTSQPPKLSVNKSKTIDHVKISGTLS
jgi:hypothetical protein